MFDRIAPRYDLLNRLLSVGTDLSWRRRALDLARLHEHAHALDVGTGTGDFALALLARSPRSATVTGVDISAGMLGVAERRAAKAGGGARYERVIASVESLPFADSTFDVAVAGFVIRNVGDIPQGLREMRRVLRPGGRAVILDLHTPRNPTIRRLYRSYSFISPRLASVLGSDPEAYRYLPRSIEAFPDPEKLAELRYCLALEQFGRTSAAFSNIISAHTSIGSMSIFLGGTEDQKRRYLPDLAAGKKIAAFSRTEPSSGSDAASIQTSATLRNGCWILNGTKIWVTNGPIADV